MLVSALDCAWEKYLLKLETKQSGDCECGCNILILKGSGDSSWVWARGRPRTEDHSPPAIIARRARSSGGRSMEDSIDSRTLREWEAEFEAAAKRPLEQRIRYAFNHTYKPVLDDAPFRAFDTMEEYRRWCETNLPDWLGYGRV
jgi:hypothetical protein